MVIASVPVANVVVEVVGTIASVLSKVSLPLPLRSSFSTLSVVVVDLAVVAVMLTVVEAVDEGAGVLLLQTLRLM